MELQVMMKHFFELYGRRNRIFLRDMLQRIVFLNLGIADLQDAIRKEVGSEDMRVALARVVSRIFCIADYFGALPLVRVMAQKYPLGRCSYCQHKPCQCPERRPDYILETESVTAQLTWDLRAWCSHFNDVYGERNRTRGIENLVNRLFKEISELLEIAMRAPTTAAEVEEWFAKELSDALAWTIAIANFYEIDLQEAVLTRYGGVCWKCQHKPCQCDGFSFVQVGWPLTGR